MNVLSGSEGAVHALVPTDLGDDAQLYLRVVGREQGVLFVARHEGLADLAPLLGADGNVLQVGTARLHASSSRHRLLVMGVDPRRGGKDGTRKHVQVGGLQLGAQPVVEDLTGYLVLMRQARQNQLVGLVLFRLLRSTGARIELQLGEEDRPHLTG